jgi:23S rRNA-/tRNA-specific pseudouridylate synthase
MRASPEAKASSPSQTLPRRARFSIRDERVGLRLIDMLLSRFPYHTQEEWEQRLRDGSVLINDQQSSPGHVLAAGDTMEYAAADIPEPAVSLAVEILHEDSDIVVVNKPAGLPCHPAGRFFHNTLWAFLKATRGLDNPEFVNRLDRETSGLVIVAKNAAAARACRAQFARRQVEKRYVVLVEGHFPAVQRATGRLCPDLASPIRRKCRFIPEETAATARPPIPERDSAGAEGGADWADTEFRLLAQHGPISELGVILHTGRTHQIRATLEALGFPVVGDKLYGGDPTVFLRFCQDRLSAADRRALRLPRQALHAAEITFRHPRTGECVTYRAELPADLREFIATVATATSHQAP